uniref:Uncharacterized protein n=1 Tax=Cajanus cajan TaxID=3821 RepID=A0A151T773_CAJCA|nr:hypothetical protein KK1_017429 [Cajanus cajan]
MATSFYTDLFAKPGKHEPFCLQNLFPELKQDDIEKLEAPLSRQEIQATLKHLGV